MRALAAILVLVPVFLFAVVAAGLDTLAVILWRRRSVVPGVARYHFEGLSPQGAVALSYLVSLTPGTTSLDLDLANKALTVHLLDLGTREASFAQVRARFERPLRAIFPERRR